MLITKLSFLIGFLKNHAIISGLPDYAHLYFSSYSEGQKKGCKMLPSSYWNLKLLTVLWKLRGRFQCWYQKCTERNAECVLEEFCWLSAIVHGSPSLSVMLWLGIVIFDPLTSPLAVPPKSTTKNVWDVYFGNTFSTCSDCRCIGRSRIATIDKWPGAYKFGSHFSCTISSFISCCTDTVSFVTNTPPLAHVRSLQGSVQAFMMNNPAASDAIANKLFTFFIIVVLG